MSRTDSRPRGSDAGRGEYRQDRKVSPATWGEGRQEGSRPPREFRERPERPERTPTAAELDNKWRSNMRPDAPVKSPEQSREGSEAPPSPAGTAAALATGGRPRLQLAKRTVPESPDVTSPNATGDAKASPFGAARPIDTAAKEKEIADKRDQLLKEKKEADDKAKEERRLAKEAAVKEAAEKAAAEKAAAEAAAEKAAAEAEAAKSEVPQEKIDAPVETKETPAESTENGAAGDQKLPTKPKEGPQGPQNPKSRAVESGNWRTAPGEQRQGRGGYVNASRGRGDGRGRGGVPRGPRGNYEGRGPRANGNPPAAAQQPAQAAAPATSEGEAAPAPTQDPDGWTTVPSKGRRQRV